MKGRCIGVIRLEEYAKIKLTPSTNKAIDEMILLEEVATVQKRAFVLMPFAEPFTAYYSKIFKPALEAAEYSVTRATDLFLPRPIILDIQRSILEADLILCEMSGRNPNVFYELGLAHAIGKPAILVSRKEDDIPFDLRHIRTILYDYTQAGWEEKLRDAITAAARAIATSEEIWPPPLVIQQEN